MTRLLAGALALSACHAPDPVAREQVVLRDQLRREVAGYLELRKMAPGKLIDREHEVMVSVSDTLLRSLIAVAFPITVELQNSLKVTLTRADVAFRANVARVDIVGELERTRFPHVKATVALRGAIDKFTVDRTQSLGARINIDDVSLGTPSGTPAALDPVVINVLQAIVERSLPELTESLPSIAIPVRLDQSMHLPGFGPEGALSIEPSTAPMTVDASRVIAFQNRLWIILHITLGAFATVPRDTSAQRDTVAPRAGAKAAP
ncbi:MAG: hypothetical protein U5K74_07245 [Gemmatimonadaceae bacterium]|nr:hypothetical protein [Gemmatimonadaceae bacterium]